jgi:hypothetical protein
MKSMFLIALMLIAGRAAALEGSLVMRSPGQGGSSLYAVVSPGTGNITLYALEGDNTTRYGSGNFLADLEVLENTPAAIRNETVYSWLRVGHDNCKPTMGDLLAALPSKPTPKEEAAGLKSLQARAVEAEDAFWADLKPYDGVVRGAMGAQYLLLCVPIKHALLAYDCQDRNKGPQLVSWRNYGVELMIPQVFDSNPTPQDLLNRLPAEIKDEQKKTIEEQMESMKEAGGAVQLEPSDPWIASGSGDRWVLVDPPNKHICTYEYQGKGWTLKSSRNLEVDQLIPTSMNSGPNEQQAFNEFVKTRQKLLTAAGIIPDVAYFKALVEQKQVASPKTSDIQASITGDDLMLDFVKLRKIFAYRINGANNQLQFVSMRDYTLDVGFSLQDVEFRSEANAVNAWAQAKKHLGKNETQLAWKSVLFAFKTDPLIYKVVEKDAGAKPLKKLPEWQATLDETIKAAEEKTKKLEERRKAAEEERARKKNAK